MAENQERSMLEAAFSRENFYQGSGGPNYFGPFGSDANPLLQMGGAALPMLFGSQGQLTLPMFPQQNMVDALRAQQFNLQTMAAQQRMRQQEADRLYRTMSGAQQLLLGRQLTDAELAQTYQGAQMVAPMMQFAPAWLQESVGGAAGSSRVMYSELSAGLRRWSDPTTGRASYRPEEMATLSNIMFARLFQDTTGLADSAEMIRVRTGMRGLSGGEVGEMARELLSTGALAPPSGSLRDQLRSVADAELTPAKLKAMVEETSQIRKIRESGLTPTSEDFQSATQSLQQTQQAIKAGLASDEALSNLAALPEAGVLMQGQSADAMLRKLEGLAGATRAIKEIFGGLGDSNASMQKIVNALQAMSGGNLSRVNPARLEHDVRTFSEIATKTIGLASAIALQSNVSQQMSDLGLDPIFANRVTTDSLIYTYAANQTSGRYGTGFGATTPEQLAQQRAQVQMGAMVSTDAKILATISAMAESAPADSELAVAAEAARSGQSTYTYDGQQKSVPRDVGALKDLAATAGAAFPGLVGAYMASDFAVQEQLYKHSGLVSTAVGYQSDSVAIRSLSRVSGTFAGALGSLGVSVSDSGKAAEAAGLSYYKNFMAMRGEDITDAGKLTDLLKTSLVEGLVASGVDEDEAKRRVNTMSEEELRVTSGAVQARYDVLARKDLGLNNRQDIFRSYSKETAEAQRVAMRAIDSDVRLKKIFSGIGDTPFGQRMFEALQKGGTFEDFLKATFNQKSVEKIFSETEWSRSLYDAYRMADPSQDEDARAEGLARLSALMDPVAANEYLNKLQKETGLTYEQLLESPEHGELTRALGETSTGNPLDLLREAGLAPNIEAVPGPPDALPSSVPAKEGGPKTDNVASRTSGPSKISGTVTILNMKEALLEAELMSGDSDIPLVETIG